MPYFQSFAVNGTVILHSLLSNVMDPLAKDINDFIKPRYSQLNNFKWSSIKRTTNTTYQGFLLNLKNILCLNNWLRVSAILIHDDFVDY